MLRCATVNRFVGSIGRKTAATFARATATSVSGRGRELQRLHEVESASWRVGPHRAFAAASGPTGSTGANIKAEFAMAPATRSSEGEVKIKEKRAKVEDEQDELNAPNNDRKKEKS